MHIESRLPATVLACLRPGYLTITLGPELGLMDFGVNVEVPVDLVPPTCRMPNSRLWVTLVNGTVAKIDAHPKAEEPQLDSPLSIAELEELRKNKTGRPLEEILSRFGV